MVEELNKKRLFDNISYMLKKSGKKIGELETEAGVSSGYISRTSKDNNTKPGIDFILKVAAILNVSVDTLLNVDLSRLTPTEQYLLSFLEKLTKDTLDDKLDWNRESAEYLNHQLVLDKRGNCDHPLFACATYMEEGEEGYPDEVTRIVFTSRSFDVHTVVAGDCYNLRMKNDTILYFMNISKSVHMVGDAEAFAKEIWMCPYRSPAQYLCGTKDAAEIGLLIEGLYEAITENARHPKVNKDIKLIIDAFMNDDIEDDADFIPIPF